ncbi:helix-turn-helix transcriptional regulator [Zhouia sp. PK063]|uniref:helix-turn-helix transcriptional regulator n=1 Tax=Zhouia sp. PK063 TaxID=3373602 RepID=UPI0037B3D9E8
MDLFTKNPRLQAIREVLIELASGNLTYALPRSAHDDDTEALVLLINKVIEEFQKLLNADVFLNPHSSYQFVTRVVFIIDEHFKICNFNAGAPSFFEVDPDVLTNTPVATLLAPPSHTLWHTFTTQFLSQKRNCQTMELYFKTKGPLYLKMHTAISKLLYPHKEQPFMVMTIMELLPTDQLAHPLEHSYISTLSGYEYQEAVSQPQEKPTKEVVLHAEKTYEYIMKHLTDPTLTIPDIAKALHTNSSKLSSEFRQVFHKSIPEFKREQQLRISKVYLEALPTSIHTIALKAGFKTAAHFTRVFKAHYGVTPSEYLNTLYRM